MVPASINFGLHFVCSPGFSILSVSISLKVKNKEKIGIINRINIKLLVNLCQECLRTRVKPPGKRQKKNGTCPPVNAIVEF